MRGHHHQWCGRWTWTYPQRYQVALENSPTFGKESFQVKAQRSSLACPSGEQLLSSTQFSAAAIHRCYQMPVINIAAPGVPRVNCFTPGYKGKGPAPGRLCGRRAQRCLPAEFPSRAACPVLSHPILLPFLPSCPVLCPPPASPLC